jgi:hypothetical protein
MPHYGSPGSGVRSAARRLSVDRCKSWRSRREPCASADVRRRRASRPTITTGPGKRRSGSPGSDAGSARG